MGALLPRLMLICLVFCGGAIADQKADEAASIRAEVPAATGFADVDSHIATLFKGYSAALTVIDTEHSAALAELKKNYDSVLERQMQFYQDGGSPAGALAVRRERQRIKQGQPLPEDGIIDSRGELKVLAEQQNRFVEAESAVLATRDGKIGSANGKLRDALELYQSELTRTGSLDRVEVVTKTIASVPRTAGNSSTGFPPSPPTTPQELANYLEGTTWTWMGARPAHARFLPGQQYETSNDATGRIFGRWPYTITENLELTAAYQNKIFRFKFDKSFEKLEVFQDPGNVKIRDGKLESRDTGDAR